MAYTLKRLLGSDGTWDALEADWNHQCSASGETLDEYAVDSMPTIKAIALDGDSDNHLRKSWAVAIYDESGKAMLAAIVHWHPMPGVDGHVLKIRQVTVCPALDAGEIDDDEVYADVLIALTWNVYQLSETELKAVQIRVHLRSPADAQFFAAFGKNLDGTNVFADVEHRGAWLRITK